METELSFLVTLLLDHKLPKATQGLLKERIKLLQTAPVPALPQVFMQGMAGQQARPAPQAQAASTLAAMAKHGLVDPVAGMVPAPPITPVIRIPPSEIDKETGRPQVVTGNGTKGARKW